MIKTDSLEEKQLKEMIESYKKQYNDFSSRFIKNPTESDFKRLKDISNYIITLNNRLKEIEEQKKTIKYNIKYKGQIIDTIEYPKKSYKDGYISSTVYLDIIDKISDKLIIEPAKE